MSWSAPHRKALKFPFLYHSRMYHCPFSWNIQGLFIFLEHVNFGKGKSAVELLEILGWDVECWDFRVKCGVLVTPVMPDSLWLHRWVACQAPLSMGVYRQEYWSGLLFPSPRVLRDPGIKPGSPVLQTDSLPSEPPGKVLGWWLPNFSVFKE